MSLCVGGRPGCRSSPGSCAGCPGVAGTRGTVRCCMPLSAATLSGFLRGLPGPDLGTRIFSSTGLNCVQSARWPGVTIKESGRQWPSAIRWIFVVKPPRERPRPSPPAPPPPGGRAGFATAFRPGVLGLPPLGGGGRRWVDAAACRVLMRPHDGGVDRHVPVDLIPPPATTPVTDRQGRPQPLPLGITQITPPQVHSNDPDMKRSHDRPDKSWLVSGCLPTRSPPPLRAR